MSEVLWGWEVIISALVSLKRKKPWSIQAGRTRDDYYLHISGPRMRPWGIPQVVVRVTDPDFSHKGCPEPPDPDPNTVFRQACINVLIVKPQGSTDQLQYRSKSPQQSGSSIQPQSSTTTILDVIDRLAISPRPTTMLTLTLSLPPLPPLWL